MIRHLARAMMAGIFIYGGVDALRNPASKVQAAEDAADALPDDVPFPPTDDAETMVLANGAVQVVGGGLLLFNILPRPASLALAGSLVPTTIGAHRFWEAEGAERQSQLLHFLKNAAMFGGLVITAMDTQGKPGVGWRAGHLVDHAGHEAEWRVREAELLSQLARARAQGKADVARAKAHTKAAETRAAVSDINARTVAPARQAVKDTKRSVRALKATGRTTGKVVGRTLTGVAGAAGTGATMAARGVKSAVNSVRSDG